MSQKLLIVALLFIVFICGCITSQAPPQPQLGSVLVSSSPSGAEIYFDGAYRGTTPATIYDVNVGNHTLELRYNSIRVWYETIRLVTAETIPVNVYLNIPTPTPIPTPSTARTISRTGVEQSSTALQIKGTVLGIKGSGTDISTIRFTVEQSAGGEPIDMSKVTMTYFTSSEVDYLIYSPTIGIGYPGTWNAYAKQNDDGDTLLEKGEVWTVQANLVSGHELTTNEVFKIEIRPSSGAVIPLSSRGPAQIDAVNSLTI